MPESGIPMGGWSGAGATRELHETIKTFNEGATRQTAKLIQLTWMITVLTGVMVLEVAWQIWKGLC